MVVEMLQMLKNDYVAIMTMPIVLPPCHPRAITWTSESCQFGSILFWQLKIYDPSLRFWFFIWWVLYQLIAHLFIQFHLHFLHFGVFYITHRIHVWYIYLRLVDYYGKYRQIYHTWIPWVSQSLFILGFMAGKMNSALHFGHALKLTSIHAGPRTSGNPRATCPEVESRRGRIVSFIKVAVSTHLSKQLST